MTNGERFPGSSPEAIEQYLDWLQVDQKRVCHEWSKWDGSEEQGIAINDAQCGRAMEARARIGICP